MRCYNIKAQTMLIIIIVIIIFFYYDAYDDDDDDDRDDDDNHINDNVNYSRNYQVHPQIMLSVFAWSASVECGFVYTLQSYCTSPMHLYNARH